ncbi:MAG: rRNA pseudouridine synthase [bacterium]|nr:rRNA pseudouridine synthase [bacterium]
MMSGTRKRPSGDDKNRKQTRPAKVGGRRKPARTSSAREAKRDTELVRLNKYLADHGVASRRGCDELISEGKVMIDGEPVTTLGTKVDPAKQKVEVDGYVLRLDRMSRRYYLLHKPAGVVCTNEKREMRPRAIDLITDKNKGRIYTVGRLDEESTGLLLLTSDGEFAERIAHPRYGVPKTYRVRVPGRVDDDAVARIRRGVHLSEGKTAGARVLIQRRTTKSSTLLVTIREGMNREIRRIFARVGYKVVSLTRTDIGPLTVRGLKVGHWRPLSRDEVEALLNASGADATEPDDDGPPRRPKPRRHRPGAARPRGRRK